MHNNETIALIRDLAIIITSGLAIILLLLTAFLLLRLYQRVKRILQIVEMMSNAVLTGIVRPLATVSSVLELVNHVIGMLRERMPKKVEKNAEEDKQE